MRKSLFTLLALAVILFAFPLKAAAESIQKFEATYDIEKSGLIRVTENITYDFGVENRHGIYRYIPYKYQLDNEETTYLNFSKFVVANKSGKNYKFERYKENNNIVLKIGDANRTVTGLQNFQISYEVKGGLRYLESGDEFYWNINGLGWDVGVRSITATVNLPTDIAPESIRAECFTGAYGDNKPCLQRDISGTKITFTASSLETAEGMSVVVGVPAGTFEKMSAGIGGSGISDTLFFFLTIVAVAFPLFTFIFMIRHWWRYGRDPKGRGTIIPEYTGPDGLTAIQVGTLLDNRVDNNDLSAEIIYLATQGYLKIRREEDGGILKKDDYVLTRLKNGDGLLQPFDDILLEGIFDSMDNEVKISDLKNKFYTHIQPLKQSVHSTLVEGGYFKESVVTTIGKYLAIAGLVGVVGYLVASGIGLLTNGVSLYLFGPAFVISALIIGVFGLAMPARTSKGVEAKERILGLKEYMRVAEGDRIKFHNAPKKDPKRFEELLPFAMALGVEKEWAKQFEGIYKGSPSWYDDPTGRIFVPMAFVNNLHSFANITTQNMTSMPSSSGSGFGGGGFSGGGFGGGGGGSW